MPKVRFEGEVYEVARGTRLRDALRAQGASPHNGESEWFNCKGFGTCGTCAVRIVSGEVAPKNAREGWRLGFPPHQDIEGMRLACQVRVEDDLEVEKYTGFWGQNTEDGPRPVATDATTTHK